MFPLRWFWIVVLLMMVNKPIMAQKQGPLLTPAIKIEVVDSLSAVLLRNYVYPDTALKMSRLIRKHLKNGIYNELNKPDEFAGRLLADLYSVYRDLHLSVYYDPGWENALRTKSYIESVSRRMKFLKFEAQQNYGFVKVEILQGNIGYLKINQFFDPNELSIKAAESAFNMVKNTNALIIDVQENGGGEPDMVRYLCSFFVKNRTHINDYYERSSNKTTAYWTTPSADSTLFLSMPLYILANAHTYSAAEEFTYDFQSIKRAKVIGQTTGGAAHGVHANSISSGFVGNIPYMRAINPVTHTNWEKTGVVPDVKSNGKNTLDLTLLNCYQDIISTSTDTDAVKAAKWFSDVIKSKIDPFVMNIQQMTSYTGVYDGRLIFLEKNNLFFRDVNGYTIGLIPLSDNKFAFTNYDREIDFSIRSNGASAMDLIKQDGTVQQFTKVRRSASQ